KLLYLEEMYCANVLSTSDYQNSRQTIERQIEEIRLGNINGGKTRKSRAKRTRIALVTSLVLALGAIHFFGWAITT
ncbi:MAG: hypothetical protein WBD51_06635, partial [Burkholderiaceae bacterium]